MEGNVVRGKILTIGKFYKWRSQTKKVTIMEWGERADIWCLEGKVMSEFFSPSEVKAIMHSKRANIYYLEKCLSCRRTAVYYI